MIAGCRTEQGFFAMVNVTQLRIQQNEVRLQTWFQPVHGLRLLGH